MVVGVAGGLLGELLKSNMSGNRIDFGQEQQKENNGDDSGEVLMRVEVRWEQ